MSDQSKITVTIKADQAAPWIVVNGDSVAETHALLNDQAFPNLALLAAQASKEFTQLWRNETAGLTAQPGSAQVQQPAPQGPPQQQAAQPAANEAPICPHGPMLFKSGVSKGSGKQWKAWMCTAPKGQSCEPQWIR